MDFLIHQRFLVQDRRFILALVFPGRDVGEMLVIAERLALGGLKFLAEMAPAGFAAVQGIQAEEFGKLHEIVHSTGGAHAAVENATRIGKDIANRLKAAGVTGVILTST